METAGELTVRLAEMGAKLLIETIDVYKRQSDFFCTKFSQLVARTVTINPCIVAESPECTSLHHLGIV